MTRQEAQERTEIEILQRIIQEGDRKKKKNLKKDDAEGDGKKKNQKIKKN